MIIIRQLLKRFAGAVIEALGNIAASGLAIGVGVLIGLALILYAQFKYNKGLF